MDEAQFLLKARQMIEQNEGRILCPHGGSYGASLIGIGRNLDRTPLSRDEAEMLLGNDLAAVRANLGSYPWFGPLNEARQLALIDVMFSAGPVEFHRMDYLRGLLALGSFAVAADALLDTAWGKQHASRAYRDARILLTGEMP